MKYIPQYKKGCYRTERQVIDKRHVVYVHIFTNQQTKYISYLSSETLQTMLL